MGMDSQVMNLEKLKELDASQDIDNVNNQMLKNISNLVDNYPLADNLNDTNRLISI